MRGKCAINEIDFVAFIPWNQAKIASTVTPLGWFAYPNESYEGEEVDGRPEKSKSKFGRIFELQEATIFSMLPNRPQTHYEGPKLMRACVQMRRLGGTEAQKIDQK